MASNEGVPASGSGSGPEKKRVAPASNERDASAAPKAAPETTPKAAAEAPVTTPKTAVAAPQATPPSTMPKTAPEPAPAGSEDLVVVTMKASTGSIVKIEVAAPDGSRRHEISASETARLAGERPTFASLVHDAFEAGIACVLDDGAGDEASAESEEDVDLHDALLDALIEQSAAKRLLSRETLTSAVLGTIIREASSKAAAPPAA